MLGRSHRSKPGKAKLKEAIDRTRAVLRVPAEYRIGIVAGSDTGAVELALWSLLGPKPVDVLAWESFGEDWVTDVVKQLKLKESRVIKAGYGALPDLTQAKSAHDIVFLWNGTTSGVRVPDGNWIRNDREGLTICDATSAAFAMDLPWAKLDVATFSWQKALGSEGGHGMIVLSPKAAARFESYNPPWPMPKTSRLTKDGKLIEGIFEGETINTPSMLAVEDYLDALKWAEKIGGLPELMARADRNLAALAHWVKKTEWVDFLAADEKTRSNIGVPEDRRSVVHGARQRGAGESRDQHRQPFGKRRGCARHRRLSRGTAGLAHLVRIDGGNGRHRESHALARLGLRAGKGKLNRCPRFSFPTICPLRRLRSSRSAASRPT